MMHGQKNIKLCLSMSVSASFRWHFQIQNISSLSAVTTTHSHYIHRIRCCDLRFSGQWILTIWHRLLYM